MPDLLKIRGFCDMIIKKRIESAIGGFCLPISIQEIFLFCCILMKGGGIMDNFFIVLYSVVGSLIAIIIDHYILRQLRRLLRKLLRTKVQTKEKSPNHPD